MLLGTKTNPTSRSTSHVPIKLQHFSALCSLTLCDCSLFHIPPFLSLVREMSETLERSPEQNPSLRILQGSKNHLRDL